jgi:tetratricopeptide (TPR) repeat protein
MPRTLLAALLFALLVVPSRSRAARCADGSGTCVQPVNYSATNNNTSPVNSPISSSMLNNGFQATNTAQPTYTAPTRTPGEIRPPRIPDRPRGTTGGGTTTPGTPTGPGTVPGGDEEPPIEEPDAAQAAAPPTKRSQYGGGSTPPPAATGKSEAAKAVGTNTNWAPEDMAKLTGDLSGGTMHQQAEIIERPEQAAPPDQRVTFGVNVRPDVNLHKAVSLSGSAEGDAEFDGRRTYEDDIQESDAAYRMGDYPRSASAARRASRRNPKRAEGFQRASKALGKMKQYKEAESEARASLEADPNGPEAWKNLAWSLLKQGRYQEALLAALKAVSLKPNYAEAWAIAAYAAERLKDQAARLLYAQKAAEADASYTPLIEAVKSGRSSYSDDTEEDSLFGDLASAPKAPADNRLPLAAGGAAAVLAAGGFAAWKWRRVKLAAAGAASAGVVRLEPMLPPSKPQG